MVKEILRLLLTVDINKPSPYLSEKVWEIVIKHIGTDNPYKEINNFYNKELLKSEEKLKNIITSSDDKFKTAIKLSITGNIIDFGAKNDFSFKTVLDKINEINTKLLDIDDSDKLYKDLTNSNTLLYLGDNNGEIIFDKIFIEYLKIIFPQIIIYFGVRGKPIINDVTKEDAKMVGMDKLVEIIDNGDGSPGTIIEKVSKEFKDLFYKVDVIISKGQGNFESLSNIDRKKIYFLFMAKCDVVAKEIGTKVMSLVCKER